MSINEGSQFEGFNMFRNIERITDFLTTLITCYKKSREKLKMILDSEQNYGCTAEQIRQKIEKSKDFYISPNEAEFFSYILIFTFDKPLDMEKNLGILGISEYENVRDSPEVKKKNS